VHFLSPRKDAPFIKVNCAALTESLLESELFGHEKGAFTGAMGERKGRFEMAHGGTLFLDEIGDISPAFQAKLLRVLQEREFERVGGSKPVKVDVRLICATNRDLEKMVQRGEYRADLYYRINVVSDLPAAAARAPRRHPAAGGALHRPLQQGEPAQLKVTPEAMKVLTSCYWPGNVRELENCIERTATMAQGDTIRDFGFPCKQNRCLTQTLHFLDKADAVAAVAVGLPMPRVSRPADGAAAAAPDAVTVIGPTHPGAGDPSSADDADERTRLIRAMEQCGWVQAKAARLLRLTPRQLGYALQKNRIEVRKF
jgi:Nif-specific regulatory protein